LIGENITIVLTELICFLGNLWFGGYGSFVWDWKGNCGWFNNGWEFVLGCSGIFLAVLFRQMFWYFGVKRPVA